MKLEELLAVRNEVERFNNVLNDSIKLARETEGYFSKHSNCQIGEHDITGTHQCGHLKREYLSLKFNLNKMLQHDNKD